MLSPAGLFLVEIKSRPGVLRGDAHSWTWTTDGRSSTYDNPLILANRKAKRLASLLRRQPAIAKAKIRLHLELRPRQGHDQQGQPVRRH
ncbi:NERD domain-containing protein [Massilia agilis]|uniref:NERD domain-containing protein n=1 Tax=Massilia agilis TaxID=1811226 RepID=A0ABT2D9C4_9BURK|nr:NERD domain-containing protein [Massilia agilis]